jgi:hypothetical protein
MGRIKKASVLAVALLGLFAGRARAQELITVRIPFAFVAGSETFPAGRYDITATDDGERVLAIRGTDNRAAGFVLTMPASGPDPAGDQPVLVFTKYEDTYRLSQIWESRDEGGVIAPTPHVK